MKKRLLALLLSALLLTSATACNPAPEGQTTGTSENKIEATEPKKTDITSFTSETSPVLPLDSWEETLSGKQYMYFNNNISQNPYDKWLEAEKAQGIRAEKQIYTDYLLLWQSELSVAVAKGRAYFSDEEEYNAWKNNLEQWLIVTRENLRIEMNNLIVPASLAQAQLIQRTGELVRQKVIDTKRFLYECECDRALLRDEGTYEFPIEWTPVENILCNND